MTKFEFILEAFRQSKIWYKASWVFSIFTIVSHRDVVENPEDYTVAVKDNKYVYALNNEWHFFKDSPSIDEPLFRVDEVITVNKPEDIIQPYKTFPFKTRAGNLFVNYYLLVYPFGNRISYQNEEMSIKKLEGMVAPLIKDDAPEDEVLYVTPEEALKFSSACTSLSGFASINTPSATRYTMLPAPGIKEYREELYRKYEGRLTDPVVIAEIDKLLVEYDKAYQKQDPEGGYYIDDKAFDVSRKKLFVSNGFEQPEIGSGESVYIKTSLAEGWEVENLPTMINTLRDGSYNRGEMTALGGEAVKFIFRIFATTKITEEDCGTRLGIPRTLTKSNIKDYIGNTIILSDKSQVKLTEENANQYVGQDVMVRSPALCKTEGANFCHACMGEKLRTSKDSLAAMASEVGSQMLYVFMKKMHGVAMKSVKWHFEDTLG